MKISRVILADRKTWLTAAIAATALFGTVFLMVGGHRAAEERLLENLGPALRENAGPEAAVVLERRLRAAMTAEHGRTWGWQIAAALVLAAGVAALLKTWSRWHNRGPLATKLDALTERSEQIAAHAAQVARDASGLSSVTSREAAGIEEIASTVEELASMTQRNAEHTRETDRLMQETRTTVTQTDASMQNLLAAIHAIQQQSTATSKIIKTIDEIAFQTNILALNAAIEAARAGEHGASFAVVAEEVRTLARHATDAARDTAALLEETNRQVTAATTVVGETSRQFAEVNGRVTQSSGYVSQIAQASTEQARGLDQLNSSIIEIEKVIQHTVASADHSADAAQRMTEESQAIDGLLGDVRGILRVERGQVRTDAGEQRIKLTISAGSNVAESFSKWTAQTPPLEIDHFDSPHANRPTVDLILQLQALAAGGLDFDYEISVHANHGRAMVEVLQGYSDLTAETVWDSEFKLEAESILPSSPVIQNGEFEKGLYVLPTNTRVLEAKLPQALSGMTGSTVFNWSVDVGLMESMGLKRIEKSSRLENVFQLVRDGRADFTLLEFAATDDMSIEAGGVKLVPVPRCKVALPGSRSWIVSKHSRHATAIAEALERGIAVMRREGKFARAFRECGFFHPAVARWPRLFDAQSFGRAGNAKVAAEPALSV